MSKKDGLEMQRISSFKNEQATLYLVATPIGNLNEMSPRALNILESVDYIAVEDTRVTGKLLHHFGINNHMIVHQKHNEKASSEGIIQLLKEGHDVALVSDAGYPLISDPGQSIVGMAANHNFNVVPVSGANAGLNALVASGLDTHRFTFIGFLPVKRNDRIQELESLKEREETLVFYESPHRIHQTLEHIYQVFGNRAICIARELTKQHEEFIRGDILTVINELDEIKGECVIVVEGYQKQIEDMLDPDIIRLVQIRIHEGLSAKDAISEVAKQNGIPKNYVYKVYHDPTISQ